MFWLGAAMAAMGAVGGVAQAAQRRRDRFDNAQDKLNKVYDPAKKQAAQSIQDAGMNNMFTMANSGTGSAGSNASAQRAAQMQMPTLAGQAETQAHGIAAQKVGMMNDSRGMEMRDDASDPGPWSTLGKAGSGMMGGGMMSDERTKVPVGGGSFGNARSSVGPDRFSRLEQMAAPREGMTFEQARDARHMRQAIAGARGQGSPWVRQEPEYAGNRTMWSSGGYDASKGGWLNEWKGPTPVGKQQPLGLVELLSPLRDGLRGANGSDPVGGGGAGEFSGGEASPRDAQGEGSPGLVRRSPDNMRQRLMAAASRWGGSEPTSAESAEAERGMRAASPTWLQDDIRQEMALRQSLRGAAQEMNDAGQPATSDALIAAEADGEESARKPGSGGLTDEIRDDLSRRIGLMDQKLPDPSQEEGADESREADIERHFRDLGARQKRDKARQRARAAGPSVTKTADFTDSSMSRKGEFDKLFEDSSRMNRGSRERAGDQQTIDELLGPDRVMSRDQGPRDTSFRTFAGPDGKPMRERPTSEIAKELGMTEGQLREYGKGIAGAFDVVGYQDGKPVTQVEYMIRSADAGASPEDIRAALRARFREGAPSGAEQGPIRDTVSPRTRTESVGMPDFLSPGKAVDPKLDRRLSSDKRMKEMGIDMVRKAPGEFYEYKDEFQGRPGTASGVQYGPMAQDLERSEMGKRAVSRDADGMRRVEPGRLVMGLVGASNDLDERLRRLERMTG